MPTILEDLGAEAGEDLSQKSQESHGSKHYNNSTDWQELAEKHLGNPLLNAEGKERDPTQKEAVVIICEEKLSQAREAGNGIAMLDSTLHQFQGTHWQALKQEDLKRDLGEFSQQLGHKSADSKHFLFRENLEKQLGATAPIIEARQHAPLINFSNGTLDFSNNKPELRDFDQEDGLTHCLNVEFDPKAKAPLFQQYLDRVIPEKQKQDVIADFLASAFVKDLKLEKALVLYGQGHNGKSVLYDVIRALLGDANSSAQSLRSIMSKPESRILILGKLINYGSELSTKGMDLEVWKALTSKEDVEFRPLYKNPFTSRNLPSLIFNANELPKETEQTEGFFRRFQIVPFEETITEQEKDPDLHSKIVATELSGVMNWILEGLERVTAKRKLSDCESCDRALNKYREESDSVALFIEQEGYSTDHEGPKLHNKEFYAAYRAFCVECGYAPASNTTFGKRAENLGLQCAPRARGGKQWFVSQKDW